MTAMKNCNLCRKLISISWKYCDKCTDAVDDIKKKERRNVMRNRRRKEKSRIYATKQMFHYPPTLLKVFIEGKIKNTCTVKADRSDVPHDCACRYWVGFLKDNKIVFDHLPVCQYTRLEKTSVYCEKEEKLI